MEEYRALLDETCGQLPKGAFLMVDGNPMTIGWAQFGVIWGRPVCTVFVRHSRHTHALLEKSNVFTVSVPAAGTMREALAYCGSHSGRDGDKLAGLRACRCLRRGPAGLRRLTVAPYILNAAWSFAPRAIWTAWSRAFARAFTATTRPRPTGTRIPCTLARFSPPIGKRNGGKAHVGISV